MKKLKLIFMAFSAMVIFNSCKKTGPDLPTEIQPPPCGNICENGGKIDANCHCNCPSGFTGANCQTKVLYPVTISIDPNKYHQTLPAWYSGDDDFGGCLSIKWSVSLKITNNNTKLYAEIFADYKECSYRGNTAAWIDPSLTSSKILLYTAPSGKTINSIDCSLTNAATTTPAFDFHGTVAWTNSNAKSYLSKIDFIGDTSGPDLPSDGTTERSRFRIYFKTFSITLIKQ
ncbi:MAG: calcium-binding EGF-like domain-containing protein [Ginsengibacter sp.]